MKIMVSGGGTGGHIYPALALMKYIKAQQENVEFLYVGTDRGLESQLVPNAGFKFTSIKIQGLKRSLSLENVKTAYYLIKSIHESKKLIKEFAPDVVIGTGGYVCAPVLYSAAKLRVPTIIHEQNSIAGLTNSFLARYVSKIAICFTSVKKDFKKYEDKVVLTGNPRGQEVVSIQKNEEAFSELGLDTNLPTVVVFGGSRGALKINQSVLEVKEQFANAPFQTVFITGDVHYDKINKLITDSMQELKNLHVFPYIKDMPNLFQYSTLVICRSGATTLTELTALGLPSVLIPSPYVTNNHQESNAQALVDVGACEMIVEKDLSGDVLFETIQRLMQDEERLNQMRNAAKEEGIVNASERLFNIIKELVD